jgi:hypothetical protein
MTVTRILYKFTSDAHYRAVGLANQSCLASMKSFDSKLLLVTPKISINFRITPFKVKTLVTWSSNQ